MITRDNPAVFARDLVRGQKGEIQCIKDFALWPVIQYQNTCTQKSNFQVLLSAPKT
jgi:hypothetical protein